MKAPSELDNTTTDINRRFVFQPNLVKMWFLVLIFGGLMFFAATDSSVRRVPGPIAKFLEYIGWDIHFVIKFVGGVGIAFTLFIIAMLIYSMFSREKRSVVLSPTTLFIPAGHFSKKINEIRYADILSVNIKDVMNQKFIRIDHKAGKIDLPQTMFKSKDLFNDCYKAILSCIKS